MGSEALYREVENFKTGGALSSEELDGLYKKRQSYNSRKALRTISGIVYFSILVFILLAFFCNPVRSFVLSQLKLSGDFLYGNILSGSFWKIRGAVFFAALIANYFLFYWKFPFFWETIGATIFSGVLLLGSVLSPYLGLLGLLLSFLASFVVNTLEDDIKKAESKRKDEIYNIALKDNDLRLMQLLSGIQCEKAITYLSRKEKEEKEREAEQQKQAEKTNQMMQDMLCGEALYNEAISSEPPLKENLMKEAARLGSINACCYIGKKLLSEWSSDMYTAEEKEALAADAAKHLDAARQTSMLLKLDIETEIQFLWLFCRVQYESNTKAQWKSLLHDLRAVQKAGDLPEQYSNALVLTIKAVIEIIDNLVDEPVVGHSYSSYSGYSASSSPSSGKLTDEEAWTAIASGMMGGPGIDGTGM